MVRPALALVLVLATAGCMGGDGDGSSDGSSTSVTASASTSVSVSVSVSTTSTASSSSSSTGTPRPAQTWEVDLQNTAFAPASLTIQKGDTVRWTQRDTAQHTVTSDAAAAEDFDSGTMALLVNSQFSHTFQEIGTSGYHCNVHPSMTGTIQVVAAMAA